VLELLSALESIIGEKATPRYTPSRIGDVPHSYAAVDAAQAALGYKPEIGFLEGLRRSVESMQTSEAREPALQA
jgi:UDP-glucose 4-epimerase